MVDAPAFYPHELPDLPIAKATILLGQSDEGEPQIVLVLLPDLIAQGAACDPKILPKEPGTSAALMFRASDGCGLPRPAGPTLSDLRC